MTLSTLFAQGQTTSFTSLGGNLTVTTEFAPRQNVALSAIWYYSPSGATALPTQVGIFAVGNTTALTTNTSPSWSGAAGSGWIKATLSTPILLQSGTSYLAAVFLGNANVGGKQTVFWTTGPGASGITNGPLTAPNYATTTVQGMVQSGTAGLTYPTVTEAGSWYGVDVEVNDTFRLFPTQSGPSAPQSYTGTFIGGVTFSVQGGGNWFDGYWYWVCQNAGGSGLQPTTPTKFALWACGGNTGNGGGGDSYVVPGSVVTSGTLSSTPVGSETGGHWNYIPLPEPIQLAPGYAPGNTTNATSCYTVAVGINGPFADSPGSVTAANDNGPLHAYYGGGSAPGAPPYGIPQGAFTATGSTDPTLNFPGNGGSPNDNFWIDVQITSTPPTGYTGSYRLYPNKADANPATVGDLNVNYTVGTQIDLSSTSTLNNIWYFLTGKATTLATRADVWDVASGLPVATIASPAWTDRLGNAVVAGSQSSNGLWIKAALPAGTSLPPGQYIVSVFNANGTTDAYWSPKDSATDYWGQATASVGANGIGGYGGPLTAPSYANAPGGYLYGGAAGNTPPYSNGTVTHAQPIFGQNPGGTIQYPQLWAPGNTGNITQNYWVDLEVTPLTTHTLFGQPNPGQTVQADATEYTLAMEFDVSATASLTGIWFYSPSGAGALPVACGVFQKTGAGTGTLIASTTSPVWSGPVASGWVRCSFPGTTTLNPGTTYKVAVAGANGSDWYAATSAYFTTGAGASGVTNGILSAPGNSTADVGQDAFYFSGGSGTQTLTYPNTTSTGSNYWIDVEVTSSGSGSDSGSGGMALPKMTLSGAGTVTGSSDSGAGAVALPKMKLAGVGGLSTSGTGGAKIPKMALAGSGLLSTVASGGVKLPKMGLTVAPGVQLNAVQWIAWDVLTSVAAEVSMAWNVGNGVQANMSQMASVPWISSYPS